MIPLNAREATDLLRHRDREIAQCRRQAEHFERLAVNERARLDRLSAERTTLQASAAQFSPLPSGATP